MTKPIKPDLSEFKALMAKPPGCTLGNMLKTLDTEDPQRAANLRAALDDVTIGHVHIRLVLRDWGYRFEAKTIARHRQKGCTCDT